MPTVKVGDINIYYEDHGDGEALSFVMSQEFINKL